MATVAVDDGKQQGRRRSGPRPVLFLDVDGVVLPWISDTKVLGYETVGKGVVSGTAQHLRSLVRAVPDIRVVLSSFHRRNLAREAALLRQHFGIEIEGATPRFARFRVRADDETGGLATDEEEPAGGDWRAYEIAVWLDENASQVESFAILDDLDLGASFKRRFVRTDGHKGATRTNAKAALEALRRPWSDEERFGLFVGTRERGQSVVEEARDRAGIGHRLGGPFRQKARGGRVNLWLSRLLTDGRTKYSRIRHQKGVMRGAKRKN
jgi:hypothetical protein